MALLSEAEQDMEEPVFLTIVPAGAVAKLWGPIEISAWVKDDIGRRTDQVTFTPDSGDRPSPDRFPFGAKIRRDTLPARTGDLWLGQR